MIESLQRKALRKHTTHSLIDDFRRLSSEKKI